MRVLALDHGAARCGLAICDASGTVITPLDVVKRPDAQAGRDEIAGIVRERDADLVLIGLPLLTSGEEGAQAAAARAFAGRLAAMIEVEVKLYDERFTTRMAQGSIADGASSAEDSLAAAHLLEEYLENQRAEGEGE